VSTPNPFKITVYDKNLARKAIVSTPISLRVIPRFNLKGTASFGLALDHPALGDLIAAGSRVVIDYGIEKLSGPVISRSINGPSISGSATFLIEDDFRILADVLGWPVPASAITAQGAAERHVVTGPAETVLKTVFQMNAIDRLGAAYTVAPDLGRGDTITVELRMESLFDKLMTAVEGAGLGVTVTQIDGELVLDVFEPTTFEHTLTEASGIVQDWSWTNTAPKVTDVVVGGREEKQLREFRKFSDNASAARWGLRAESFVDARDVGTKLNEWYGEMKSAQEATPPDTAAIDALNATYPGIRSEYESLIAKRGAEALAEGSEKTGIRMVLSETDSFRYGTSVTVGGKVAMAVGPGLTITDTLREAELTWSFENGVTATPSVGEITDNPDRVFAKALRNSATRIRKIEVK
jgi:hypothetical protein